MQQKPKYFHFRAAGEAAYINYATSSAHLCITTQFVTELTVQNLAAYIFRAEDVQPKKVCGGFCRAAHAPLGLLEIRVLRRKCEAINWRTGSTGSSFAGAIDRPSPPRVLSGPIKFAKRAQVRC